MRQGFTSEHFLAESVNTLTGEVSAVPAGGHSFGIGFMVGWQNGPLGRGEERRPPNGAFVEDVLDAVRNRIEFYQRAGGGRFACEENAEALGYIDAALAALDRRTKAREARLVEGTHAP